VWSDGVLEHFDEPELALREMVRAARPQGAVTLLLPAARSLHTTLWRPIRRAMGRFPFDRWGRERAFSRRSLETLMSDAGLERIVTTRSTVRRSLLDDDLLLRRARSDEARGTLRRLFAALDRAEERFAPIRALGFAVVGAGLKSRATRDIAPRDESA